MSRGYPHVSLWTTLACAGGAPVRRLTGWVSWAERHAIEDGLVTHRFTGTLPLSETADLEDGRCLRVARSDTDIREYLIEEVRDGANDGGLATVSAVGVEFLLATLGLTTAVSIEADPADAVDAILADAPAWLVTGTVTPTATIDVETVGGGASFGAALGQLIAACRRNDEWAEVWLARNGDTEYLVHVSSLGSGYATIDLPYRTGLTGLTRTRHRGARLTHAVDPGAGVAESFWVATVVTATQVTVEALHPGLGPAIEADQWNTHYALRDNAGNLHVITDTEVVSAAATRFTMADSTGIAVGELVALVLAAGGPILSATLPSLAAPVPLVRPVASGADPYTNLFRNPAFRLWDGSGPLGGYTGSHLTTSRSTATGSWRHGGSSYQLEDDADRYVAQSLTFYAPADGAIHYAYAFKPIANSQYMYTSFTDPGTGGDTGDENADCPPALGNGTWYERTRSYFCPAGVVTLGITVRNNGGGESGERADLYLDTIGVYYAPSLPAFREGSGPGRAIAAANLALSQLGGVQASYAVRPLDLYKMDPLGMGRYREIRLGGMARVICDPLGVRDTVRMVDHTEPGVGGDALALTLSTRLRTLTSALGGGVAPAPTFEFGPPAPNTILPSAPVTPPPPANMIVGDGGTTVDPCHAIEFTSGATVTDAGAGVAEVEITGGGGGGGGGGAAGAIIAAISRNGTTTVGTGDTGTLELTIDTTEGAALGTWTTDDEGIEIPADGWYSIYAQFYVATDGPETWLRVSIVDDAATEPPYASVREVQPEHDGGTGAIPRVTSLSGAWYLQAGQRIVLLHHTEAPRPYDIWAHMTILQHADDGSSAPAYEVLESTVTLDRDEVNALPTTPFAIVPAPGGSVGFIVPLTVTLVCQGSENARANIAAAATLTVGFASGGRPMTVLDEAGGQVSALLNLGAASYNLRRVDTLLPVPSAVEYTGSEPVGPTPAVDEPLLLIADNDGAGDFTGGNYSGGGNGSHLVVITRYMIVPHGAWPI